MAPPPAQRARPYRDFLTPTLHRQFVHAALLSLVACYIPAVWLSNSGYLWRFLPLGTAFRAVVLFLVSDATVLLARLSGQHAGTLTTVSPAQTFQRALLNPSTYFTIIAYLVSAVLFAEITALSYHSDSYVKLVNPGSHNERAHINEQGIFFRALFPVLALTQALYHLYWDMDQLRLPYDKTKSTEPKSILLLLKSQEKMTKIFISTAIKTVTAGVIGGIGFLLFFRNMLWHWCFSVMKNFYFFPRNASSRNNRGVRDGLAMVFMSYLIAAFLLTLVWDISNLLFSEFMTEQPMKKGQPITIGSRDPNGSLLSGLRAKHELTKTRAFWELVIISNRFDDRRKTVYSESDRATGSTWSQLSAICLQELAAVSVRISEFNTSLHPPQPAPLPPAPKSDHRSLKGPKSDPSIYIPKPAGGLKARAKDLVSEYATSHLLQPGAANPPMLLAEKAYGMLSEEQRASMRPDTIRKQASGVLSSWLKSALGYPFRQTFGRRMTRVICGTPYSETSVLTDAIGALSRLTASSIAEDNFGQVQKDVYKICRTYAAVITHIQGLIASAPAHYTDVQFDGSQRKPTPEIEALLQALRRGLEVIMRAFGEYFDALHIPKNETRQWTQLLAAPEPEAASRPAPSERIARQPARPRTPPMQQVSR